MIASSYAGVPCGSVPCPARRTRAEVARTSSPIAVVRRRRRRQAASSSTPCVRRRVHVHPRAVRLEHRLDQLPATRGRSIQWNDWAKRRDPEGAEPGRAAPRRACAPSSTFVTPGARALGAWPQRASRRRRRRRPLARKRREQQRQRARAAADVEQASRRRRARARRAARRRAPVDRRMRPCG